MEKTPLILNDRELSKKEIRMLKELTTTRGELKSWEWLKKPKYRMFILEVFTSFSGYGSRLSDIAKIQVGCHLRTFISELFDIPDHWSQRTRGQDQKLTYRCNRFEETIRSIYRNLTLKSAELGIGFLWRIDMSRLVEKSIPHRNRGYHLHDFLIVAKNKLEASSLALTMIGGPLGSDEPVSSVKFLGHPDFFDYLSHNSNQLAEMHRSFDKDITEARERLKFADENKERVNYISAIVSQAGMMINGTI